MLTLKDFDKVLVSYKRKKDRYVPSIFKDMFGDPCATVTKVRGEIKGVIVSTGPGIIGWSLCDKKDTFDKAAGLNIALTRAKIAARLSLRDRESFYLKVPVTLLDEAEAMMDRSELYFKELE